MEPVPQIYLDELTKAHGNISATMRVLNAVEDGYYIPMEALLDSVRSMYTDLSKQAPNAYIFGSGLINPLGKGNYEKYTEMLVENGNHYVTIGDTQASQFLERFGGEFKDHLDKAIEATGSTLEPDDILQGYTRPDGTRAPGLWDDISRGYAENAKGNIITVTPHAPHQRIFVQTELPALLNNAEVDAINGLPKAVFVDEFNALRASGLPVEKAYTKLNDTLVRGSSIEYMKRFAAPHFGSDLGQVREHDFTKAAHPAGDLLNDAKPETSLFRGLFKTSSSDMTLPDDLKSTVNPSTFVKSNIIIGTGVGGAVFVGSLAFGNSPAQAADIAVEVVEPAYWGAGMLAAQGEYDLALDESVRVTPEVIGCAIGGVIASPGIVTSAAGCAVGGYMAHEALGLPVNDWFEQRHHERVMEQMAVLGAQQAEGVEANPEILALQAAQRADEYTENDPDFIRLSAGFGYLRLGLDDDGYYGNDVRNVLADPNTNPDAIDLAMRRYPGMVEGVLDENGYDQAKQNGSLNNNAQTMQENNFTATVNTNDTIQYLGMKL